MSHSTQDAFLPEERILDVSPRFSPRVGEPHARRLNYVAGRSLTADALQMEQFSWDAKNALIGRALNPGILSGLEVELLSDQPGTAAVRVTAGTGITDLGEDVVLHKGLTARLADIPAAEALLEEDEAPVGLIGLFLKPARAVSANARSPEDPCPVDPEAYAYDDLITQDAAKLVWASLGPHDAVRRPAGDDLLRPVRPQGAPADRLAVLGPLTSTNTLMPPKPLLNLPDPYLLPTSVLRSIRAGRVIQNEEEAIRRGKRVPWSSNGLPLAIAEVTEDGHVLFLDRFAIARMGGAVRQANPGQIFGLTPPLRRARFDQFLDHLQAIRGETADPSPATRFFRHLPPVGVLPATLFDTRNLTCGFFPQNFVIEAAPIQLTQMEALLAARSGLEPFDLARRDYVQLLVPVPDHLFDPRLLLTEDISPLFQKAITAAEVREAQLLAQLAEFDAIEAFIMGVIDMRRVRPKAQSTPGPDSKAALYAKEAEEIVKGVDEETSDVPLSAEEAKTLSQQTYLEAAQALSAGSAATSGFRGLRPTVAALARKLDTANDTADMGFLRLQSDIFRVRKQLVGEEDATRLATSPVLANLAHTTTGLETSKLFSSIVTEAPKPKTQLKLSAAAMPQIMTIIAPIMAEGGPPLGTIMAMETAKSSVSESISIKYEPRTSYTKTFTGSFGKTVTPIEPVKPAPAVKATDIKDLGLAGIKADLNTSILQASDIAWHGLIYGKASPIRTATVAERLRPSPAQEAKNSAVATKAEVVRGIQELGLNLEGLPLPVSASRVTLIPKTARDSMIGALQSQGGATNAAVIAILTADDAMPLDGDVAVLSDKHLLTYTAVEHPQQQDDPNNPGRTIPNTANVAIYKKVQEVAGQLYETRLGLDHDNLAGLILADRLDPDPDDPDEAAFFAAAVDALESAVSILRLFEGRVQSYAAFLDRLRKALVEAIDLSEKWTDAKDYLHAEIAEAVHDQEVGTALMIEEQARLDAINMRRRDILEKHVDIVAFARPMTADRLKSAPGLPLYRPLTELMPACLESEADLPDELEEILEAMRDAPVGWYPQIAAELGNIRQPRHYINIWQRGLDRAGLWLARNAEAKPAVHASGDQARVAGKATTGVYLALAGLMAQRKSLLATRLTRKIDTLNGASWTTLNTLARDELSIEDLETGGKAGRKAGSNGAKMIAEIGAVAGCFLEGLRQVPAEIRLIWADTLSAHDKAIDLSDINAARGWAAIPFEQRRGLEVMHQWLFARIDIKNAQARGMMSTLIRVCLLMSSHAPVSSIVEGVTVETRNIEKGESFLVDVKQGSAGIGMIATIGTGADKSRGVIEDLVGNRALVRVTDMRGPRISLAQQEPISFSAPVAITMANLKV